MSWFDFSWSSSCQGCFAKLWILSVFQYIYIWHENSSWTLSFFWQWSKTWFLLLGGWCSPAIYCTIVRVVAGLNMFFQFSFVLTNQSNVTMVGFSCQCSSEWPTSTGMFLQLSQEPNVARAATDSDNPPKQSGEGWSLLSGLSQSAAIGHVLPTGTKFMYCSCNSFIHILFIMQIYVYIYIYIWMILHFST